MRCYCLLEVFNDEFVCFHPVGDPYVVRPIDDVEEREAGGKDLSTKSIDVVADLSLAKAAHSRLGCHLQRN